MKKCLIICLGLMLSCVAPKAQTTQPILTVTGESKIFQAPDIMEVTATISTLDVEYSMSLEKNLKDLDQFKRALRKAKISSLVIKDVSQRVNEERSYKAGKSEVVGYRANYRLILQFSAKAKEIHQVLNVLRLSGVTVDYRANFKLSRPLLKKVQSKLISGAVDDAISKANIISKASSTQLQSILKMEYGKVGVQPRAVMYMGNRKTMDASVGGEAFSEPDAIEMTDNVEITWSIK